MKTLHPSDGDRGFADHSKHAEADPASLAETLPALLVEADRIARTVAQGVHGRRRTGPGESFWQFRRHRDGDPAHSVDWRRSARSDHLFVRETEWEAAQSVYLLCDNTAPMTFASSSALPTKRDRAAVLTLAIASLLLRGGEQVAIAGSGRWPSSGRATMDRLAEDISTVRSSGIPSSSTRSLNLDLPRHAQIVIFSDFFSPPQELSGFLSNLAAHNVKAHLVQILDPAEETLPYQGRMEFEDMGGTERLTIGRVESVREAYLQRLAAHRAAVGGMARKFGFSFCTHRTDRSAASALLALYGVLMDGADVYRETQV